MVVVRTVAAGKAGCWWPAGRPKLLSVNLHIVLKCLSLFKSPDLGIKKSLLNPSRYQKIDDSLFWIYLATQSDPHFVNVTKINSLTRPITKSETKQSPKKQNKIISYHGFCPVLDFFFWFLHVWVGFRDRLLYRKS